MDSAKLQKSLGDAAGMLGAYNQDGEKKLTLWLDSAVFEDTVTYGSEYIYIQRSFANPAASPAHNAYEIGDRTWKGNNKCSVRRALFEEAQEVKAKIYNKHIVGDSVVIDSTVGQKALEIIRKNSNLYRQLASRYILIGHSMGGVVSREYVQGNFYNGDVDKFIMLDSPHEGTGTLDIQIGLLLFCSKMCRKSFKENWV
ncbi:triacylglycerol lipase [Fibrobacter sp. UWH1]|uniref:esterase/lipase family protein n=1 Tax=Fibrobacter sp. UWH1 TaxID=1964354 RepID=UPI001C3D888D|nr:GPI inositol-deacylase [Fibrobacter sp. UWH1]